MIELPGGKGRYMLLEELILHYIGKYLKVIKSRGICDPRGEKCRY